MQRRRLEDLFPLNMLIEGGGMHNFIRNKKHLTVADLDGIAIDDRSGTAIGVFTDVLWQIGLMSKSDDYSSAMQIETFQIASKWISARFEYDKKNCHHPDKKLNIFYKLVMEAMVSLIDDIGKVRFVNILASNGLIDMACSDGIYYMDWLAMLALEGKLGAAEHLILSGYCPKTPGFYNFLEFSETHNTTALCYLLKQTYIAALLERAGFPANKISTYPGLFVELHWLTDISLYPGSEYADFRANYMHSACGVYSNDHDGLAKNIDWVIHSAAFSSLSFNDTHKAAVRFSTNPVRNVIRGILRSKVSSVQEGVFDPQVDGLPQWMELSADMPLILAKESNEHRKLILNYTGKEYQRLIKVLAGGSKGDNDYLDAYVIYNKSDEQSDYVLNHPSGTLLSLEQLNLLMNEAVLKRAADCFIPIVRPH